MIDLSFIIGNLNKEHGGAQQLLFDLCRHLPETEFDTRVYYMFGEGTYQDAFEEQGTTIIDLGASSNYDVTAFRRLIDRLHRADHDILQTNSPISGIWGRISGNLTSVPEIISVEHSVHTEYPWFTRVANGVTLPLSDTIVGVSETVIDSITPWERTLLSGQTRIETIRNGVDVAAIESEFAHSEESASEIQVSQQNPLIGTVGRFTPAKGYKYLIRAFPSIKECHPQAQLLMIGDGETMPKLQKEAKATGYDESIYFTGYLPNVFPYLPILDVAVFPSLWEGLPLAPIESMVARLPVVVTNIDAFREAIGDAGVYVEPRSEDEIASAVSSLLDNPSRSAQLGQQAYDHVVKHMSIDRTVQEYADLYRSVENDR